MRDRLNSLIADTQFDWHPQARRHILGLVAKTLAYVEHGAGINLKLVIDHLQELLDGAPEPVQALHFRTVSTSLQQNAAQFNATFQSVFQEAMGNEERLAVPELLISDTSRQPASDPVKGVSLSLIDMKEVERILLLDRIVLRFTEFYEAGLNPLTERIAVLLGLKVPVLSRNPFRPEVFVRSMVAAWEKCGFDPQASQYLLLSLEPMHCLDLGPLYVDLNSTLMHAGIKALGKRHIRKSSTQAPDVDQAAPPTLPAYGRRGLSAGASALSERASEPAAVRAQAFLRQLGRGAPRGAGARGDVTGVDAISGYTPTHVALLAYLGQQQAGAGYSIGGQLPDGVAPGAHNVLRQMRQQEQVRNAPEVDRGAVDALSEVFDFVFSEEDLALQMRQVMGRLQIPVLKAAMLDRNFFLSAEQPARRLVDTLTTAALAWTPDQGQADPVYVRVEKTIQRVLTEFKDDVTLFGELVGEVSEFLFESERQTQGQIAPITEQEQRSELFEQALLHAGDVIDATIRALPGELPLAPLLAPFLKNQWREVMARAWVNVQNAPQQWEQASTVMKQLIWSTQPKTNSSDRVQLVAVLPELVRNLNIGLDAIGWSGEDRANFTRRLMAAHTMAIRMTRTTSGDTGAAALTDSDGEAGAAGGRQPPSQTVGSDEFDAMVQRLNCGLWFDFKPDSGRRQRYCLSWISPLRTRMLFTRRNGADPLLRSAREVAAMLRQGQLHVIGKEPIVSRALNRILSGAQDPQEN